MNLSGDWYARQAADAENKAEIARRRGWADLAQRFEALASKIKAEAIAPEIRGTNGQCGCCGWYVRADERACHGDCTGAQCARHFEPTEETP